MLTMDDGVKLKIIDFIPKSHEDGSPVLLFVAGWISLVSGWRGFIKEFTKHGRIIYVETREKRSSVLQSGKKVEFTIDRHRNDIKNIVDIIFEKDDNFSIAGSSLGATAILEYLALNRRNPQCAALITPNPEFNFPAILSYAVLALPASLYFLTKPVVKWYLRNFRLDKKNAKEQITKYEMTLDEADPHKLKANALTLRKYSIWDRLNKINTPCLFMGAAQDTLHDTGKIKKMLSMINRSEYIELLSNIDTHSEKGAEAVISYIKKNVSAAQKK